MQRVKDGVFALVGPAVAGDDLRATSDHHLLDDPTFADAILDRLVHNAYKLKFTSVPTIIRIESID